MLTASEGDIWDTQCAGFYLSLFIIFTFIPANPYSRSIQRILKGDFDNVPLFILLLPIIVVSVYTLTENRAPTDSSSAGGGNYSPPVELFQV